MYCMLLLVALAGCAHAAVPEYLDALSNYDVSVKELRTHVLKPNKNQVNYLVLKAAVSLLADAKLLLNLEPRSVYNLVTDVATVLAQALPKVVQGLANKRHERAARRTAKLRKVVKDLCLPTPGSLRSAGKAACDVDVDAAVKKDRRLQYESPVLLAASDAGAAYYKLRNELNNAAKSAQSVQKYLKNGKEKLLSLVSKVVRLYNLTDRNLLRN